MALGTVGARAAALIVAAGAMILIAEAQGRAATMAAAETATEPSAAPEISGTQSTKAAVSPTRATGGLSGGSARKEGKAFDASSEPTDPTAAILTRKLADPALGGAANGDDVGALRAFYSHRNGAPLWVADGGLSPGAKALIDEIRRADDWGLSARDFELPQITQGETSPEAFADTEIKVGIAVLKYARHARGGRVAPSRISQLFDQQPPLRQPSVVLADLAASDAPDAYLRSLHPKHEQFERLRQALLKARGKSCRQDMKDEASQVMLPPAGSIAPGVRHPDVAILRQRLKVSPEDRGNEDVYDATLRTAVEVFQKENGLLADGIIGERTRAALNGDKQPSGAANERDIQRLLINMERWRWMPEELGQFYVWDNVPEFKTRIVKNGRIVHDDKIIVGQLSWPTPVFSADMRTVVFQPEWNVPDGIKVKELLPLLRKSSGQGFFDFFGGGYSSRTVLEAHDLKASYNGRPVDPDQVDWNSTDIRRFSFTQPPGPKNVLGDVKFLFPNKHSVYMHDTPLRELFAQSNRAISHGCMRIGDPRRFAEVILGEDKGWAPSKVAGMMSGGYSSTVALDRPIPVHVTYFTAAVDDNGNVETFGDLYGLDTGVARALFDRPVQFEAPPPADPVVAGGDPSPVAPAGQPRKKRYSGPPTLADMVSGLVAN